MEPQNINTPSPMGAPQDQAVPTGPELSPEEMQSNISDMMSKIDNRYQSFNSDKLTSDNELESLKDEVLKKVFELFQEKGVDPSNEEQVQSFLDAFRQESPELADQLEEAMNFLVDGTTPPVTLPDVSQETQPSPTDNTELPPVGSPVPPSNNMNNENIQQNI